MGSGVKAALGTLTASVQVRILAPQLKSVRCRCEHVFVPRYNEESLREAVALSDSLSEVLRRFGLRPAGGNHRLLREWIDRWDISTEHFTQDRPMPKRDPIPLSEILIEHSTFNRGHLKERLYADGLKERRCELCG